MGWKVIKGQRSSKSTLGANKLWMMNTSGQPKSCLLGLKCRPVESQNQSQTFIQFSAPQV